MSELPLTLTHWGAYRVRSENGRPVEMRPFERDPDPSPIGNSMVAGWAAECRVRRPAVRRGYLERGAADDARQRGREPFVEVTWDDVTEIVAAEVQRVRSRFGNEAIFGGSYGWSSAGRFHHAQSQLHRFLNSIGGYTNSVNTYSVAAGEVIVPHILGVDPRRAMYESLQPTWDEIAEHAELIVAFGGMAMKNRQVGAGGPARHLVRGGLERLSDAGVRLVSVSFSQNDAPAVTHLEHFSIRPCTDTALMLGLAHTLVDEGRWDEEFVRRCTVGIDRFLPYLLGHSDGQPKDADWASGICGADPEAIRKLARDMSAHRTLVTVAMSLQRQEHGEQPWWMAMVLAAFLGQIGLTGRGVGFAYGSLSPIGSSQALTRWPSLPQGSNPVTTFIPVARISDMLLHPGQRFAYNGRTLRYPDIRMIWWAGGNPFHHHQDLNRLRQAWQRPETIVAHEIFWNPHARHADIVLPATTSLERNDLGCSSLDPHLIAMKKIVDPVGESASDFAILSGLSRTLGGEADFTQGRDEMEWLQYLYGQLRATVTQQGASLPEFADFWAAGVIEVPFEGIPRTRLCEDFRRDPDKHPVATPSGRIEIYSSTIAGFGYDDCPGHPVWREPTEWPGGAIAERFPLFLSSHQPSTRLHSQYDHGATSTGSKIQGREPMAMHPVDAAARQISDGDIACIFNDRGACLAAVRLVETLTPGVVQMATGAWFHPVDLPDGQPLDSHGNPNVVTADVPTSQLAQGPCVNAMVQVRRWIGDLPPLTPFEAPSIVARESVARHLRTTSR